MGLISGADAQLMCAGGQAAPLAGGLLAFTHGKLVSPDKAGRQRTSIHPIGELIAAAAETADPEAVRACLARLVEPTHPYVDTVISGPSGRPLVMGVLNVTPDSFSDGGDYADTDTAIAHGRALHAAGADLIDVGGESTRPSATPVTVEAEICRVMPVVTALAGEEIPVSIDTRRAAVMDEAIAAGATVVNDVSALQFDPAALDVVAASAASVILMHMQGAPETMQAAPHYDDVVLDVYAALARRVAACEAAGIDRSRICVDPGIGFGKTVAHNMALISALGTFHGLGCAVAIGVSRKSFIDAVAGTTQPKDRLAGSLAAMLTALDQGAQIVRVHDVAKTVQAVALWREAQMAP